MRRLPLLLTTLVLAAPARAEGDTETAKDERSGLVVQVPEQWSRESGREKGSVKFAAIYDLNRTKYVIFSVETGPATGFDEAPWLANEKASHAKFLKTADIPWTTEPTTVGGVRTTRYTIGGKTEKGDDMRIRGCGFVHNDVFFRILEVSSGGAHAEAADAIKAIWDAVKFEDANPFADEDEDEEEEGSGEEEKPAGEEAQGEEAPKGEPIVIEDKAAGFKISVLPGWELRRTPVEDPDTTLRVEAARSTENGIIASIGIYRIREVHADVFTTEEPGDVLVKRIHEGRKFFEDAYEADSAGVLRPEIDVRVRFGGVDKSCAYEIRGLALSEEAKIEEAKKLIARGQADVVVPEFKPIVVRGRIAMISPYYYIARCDFSRAHADNEELLAEVAAIFDSMQFETTEGMPPPLSMGEQVGDKIVLTSFGNTLADPANKDERKKSKTHEFKRGTKVEAALKIDYVLPPGFKEADKVVDVEAGAVYSGQDLPLQVIAQDGNNGWVWIRVTALSSKTLGSNQSFEDKKKTFDTWISNFESKARGTGRLPKKPEDVKVGNLHGDGCELEGRINNFRSTEVNMVTVQGGWWIKFEMRTRGKGSETFASGIKTFLKRFKAAKK